MTFNDIEDCSMFGIPLQIRAGKLPGFIRQMKARSVL
jgi:hypothetical protein